MLFLYFEQLTMSMAMVTACCSSSSSISKHPSSHCTYNKLTSNYNRNHLFRLSICPSSTQIHRNRSPSLQLKCQAAGDDGFLEPLAVYQGVYGPWSVDSSDIREVYFLFTFNQLKFVAFLINPRVELNQILLVQVIKKRFIICCIFSTKVLLFVTLLSFVSNLVICFSFLLLMKLLDLIIHKFRVFGLMMKLLD